MSTPRPRAPYFRAASITMRPSPEPRSISSSPGFGSASLSIRSTTSGGDCTYGTVPSSQAQDCACTNSGSKAKSAIGKRRIISAG